MDEGENLLFSRMRWPQPAHRRLHTRLSSVATIVRQNAVRPFTKYSDHHEREKKCE